MPNAAIDPKRIEALGPAERVIHALTSFTDHMVHNRPGIVIKDGRANIGVRWEPVTWKLEGTEGAQEKVVYRLTKVGKKTTKARIGVLDADGKTVKEGRTVVGEYRLPGLFPEVVTWMYRQVADVFKMDNEFAAHWASWAFTKDHKDMKVVLAAFLLVQNRKGEPVVENGETLFHDDDFRDVGEAMCLIRDKNDLNPKLLLRVVEVLETPGVAEINREMGFTRSLRNPTLGRADKAIEKWLRFREANPRMLDGLVRAGFGSTVKSLARKVGYKPTTKAFFEILRWKQAQAKDGRRVMAIGEAVKAAESWEGLTERQICTRIGKEKPGFKRIVGLLPKEVGLTRAVMAAAIEAGCLSDADMIIMIPTFEELGLLTVPGIADKIKAAADKATNQRATNIARNVKTKVATEILQTATDKATVKAFEAVTKGLRVYVIVDKSGSMQASLEKAKGYITRFLAGFPLDRLHVSVFNTMGSEVVIKAPKAVAVEQAFRNHSAGGGTIHAQGVLALAKYKPKADEDTLMIFIGDEGEYNHRGLVQAVKDSGIRPAGFGLLKVPGENGSIVRDTAKELGIPCFEVQEDMFQGDDPYAITRLLQNLVATTPVGIRPATTDRKVSARKSLVQEILETPMLSKPQWAMVG